MYKYPVYSTYSVYNTRYLIHREQSCWKMYKNGNMRLYKATFVGWTYLGSTVANCVERDREGREDLYLLRRYVNGFRALHRAQNLKSRPWFGDRTRLNYTVKGAVDLNHLHLWYLFRWHGIAAAREPLLADPLQIWYGRRYGSTNVVGHNWKR